MNFEKYIPAENRIKYMSWRLFQINLEPADAIWEYKTYFSGWGLKKFFQKNLTFILLPAFECNMKEKFLSSSLTLHVSHIHNQVRWWKSSRSSWYSTWDILYKKEWCTSENWQMSTNLECMWCYNVREVKAFHLKYKTRPFCCRVIKITRTSQ